ncbi:hypothetical protein ATCC90586_012129 [Pythium insidiosum]|nr:hypothetical protein ATCC90586_012129 [Pythium insidiosum]
MLHKVTQFYRPEWLLVGAAILALSQMTPPLLDAMAVATPSANKPFGDLAGFRPHYMREHQDATAVTLHVVGTSLIVLLVLAHPELLGAGVLALQCGRLAFACFRALDHGLFEALVVLSVFFATVKFLRGSVAMALVALAVGYSFAWTGHFFFERNRPATFVYPTYSLVCDFLMWIEVLTGVTVTL